VGILPSNGVRHVWALLLDGTYMTNGTYVSVVNAARPKRAS
jgi:hypothetical protein